MAEERYVCCECARPFSEISTKLTKITQKHE
jgi:hypothetical protein